MQTKQEKEYKARGQRALDEAKRTCLRLGFEEFQVSYKLEIRKMSKAMDILHEGARGEYDAVVLGQRGINWLEEAFDESVTKDIMKKQFNFPIWLCKKPEPDRKNVLLCVDGSDAAYRMADHVGFILRKDKDHEITLFTAGIEKKRAPDIIAKASEHLIKNEFPETSIKTLTVSEKNVAKAILQAAEDKEYAVVAVGRRKPDQNALKKLFLGSVSTRLFNELEGASLWISY